MARNNLWLLIAACICTCYKNEMNRPEVFQGRLAQAIEEYRRPRSVAMPAYLDKYGNIGEGKMCRLSKLYVGYNKIYHLHETEKTNNDFVFFFQIPHYRKV